MEVLDEVEEKEEGQGLASYDGYKDTVPSNNNQMLPDPRRRLQPHALQAIKRRSYY